MNLSTMSIEDLISLRDALSKVQQAATVLAGLPGDDSEVALTIDLTPGCNVTITTHYVMPSARSSMPPDVGPVLIEIEPVAERNADRALRWPAPMVPTSDGSRACTAPVPGAASAAPAAQDLAAKPRRTRLNVASTRRSGPFDDAEKAYIVQAVAQGQSPAEAAAHLNRGRAIVALLMKGVQSRVAPAPDAAPVTAPADVAPVADRVAAPVAAPAVAPITAPIAVPVAAPVNVSPASPASAPPAMDAVIPSRQREITAALAQVSPRRGFDGNLDLEIVEGYALGRKTAQLALDLDCDAEAMSKRFRDLTECIRDARGQLAFDAQADLIAVLRRKVAGVRAARGAA